MYVLQKRPRMLRCESILIGYSYRDVIDEYLNSNRVIDYPKGRDRFIHNYPIRIPPYTHAITLGYYAISDGMHKLGNTFVISNGDELWLYQPSRYSQSNSRRVNKIYLGCGERLIKNYENMIESYIERRKSPR